MDCSPGLGHGRRLAFRIPLISAGSKTVPKLERSKSKNGNNLQLENRRHQSGDHSGETTPYWSGAELDLPPRWNLPVAGLWFSPGRKHCHREMGVCLSRRQLAAVFFWPIPLTLGAFAFLVPFDVVSVLGKGREGTTLTFVVGGAAGVTLLVVAYLRKRLERPQKAAFWWLLFIILAAASSLWALDPSRTAGPLAHCGRSRVVFRRGRFRPFAEKSCLGWCWRPWLEDVSPELIAYANISVDTSMGTSLPAAVH